MYAVSKAVAGSLHYINEIPDIFGLTEEQQTQLAGIWVSGWVLV